MLLNMFLSTTVNFRLFVFCGDFLIKIVFNREFVW